MMLHRLLLLSSLFAGTAILVPFAYAQTERAVLPQVAAAQGNFQRLEDILRQSYADNPTLRAARAEMRATRENLPQAQAGWKPSVLAEADAQWADIDQSPSVAGSADGSFSKQAGLTISQPLYRGGRTVAAVEGAENIIAAQQSILNATSQRVMRDVAAAYMDVVRDQAVLELRTNNESVIARQLEATRDRFEVGELTRTDVSQAEARFARAQADRTQAVGSLRTSESVFRQLTGSEPGLLGYPELSFNLPPHADAAMSKAENDNPTVIASHYRHKAAEADIDGIFGELLPQISAFGSLNQAYDPQPGLIDDSTTTAVGVLASWQLYSGGATRSRVRQARHVSNQRYIGIQEARQQAMQEAVANWESLQTAKAEIKSRTAQTEAARIAKEGVYQEAELGSRTILDTLDADQEYLDAQVALVTARRNETVATFFLAATLGLLTPATLGFSEIDDRKEEVMGPAR